VKHRYTCVLLLVLFSAPFAAFSQSNAPSKPLTPLEQTLMASEKSFVDAAKKGDPAFLKRTLTDDFSFVAFDGQLADRQDMIDMLSGGGVDLLPYDMKVVPVSDGVAIVTYDVVLRVQAVEDEGPPPRYQHFSTVWVKQSDDKQGSVWKMKFQQQSVAHWGDW
jgi:hypothetical protein